MLGLLIVDVQNDYFPGGKFELYEADSALKKTRLLLDRFRKDKKPVIFVQHINDYEGAAFFEKGAAGAEIHEDIMPLPDERVVVKYQPNGFYKTGLADTLREAGIDELVVCGMMTHMCIDTTVRAAKDEGFPVTLISDACAARELSIKGRAVPADVVQDAFLAALDGVFARVMTAAEYLG